jgi:DNA-directed RNA polymerase subunit L
MGPPNLQSYLLSNDMKDFPCICAYMRDIYHNALQKITAAIKRKSKNNDHTCLTTLVDALAFSSNVNYVGYTATHTDFVKYLDTHPHKPKLSISFLPPPEGKRSLSFVIYEKRKPAVTAEDDSLRSII